MAVVLGAMPHYGNCHPRCAAAFWWKATRKHQWMPSTGGGSLLAHVFNVLWLQALVTKPKVNAEWWAMLHSDVIPAGGWLDTLIEEAEEHKADVVSAVLPIKDRRGVTSIAIDDPADPWAPLRRLTMREVFRLPETFDAADCGYPGNALLINTGCMVVNLKAPWVDEFPGFEIRDTIRNLPDGSRTAMCAPEDWNFSRWLHQRNIKYVATRKVHADHVGEHRYPNDSVWGEETDPAYVLKHGNQRVPPVAEITAPRVADRAGSLALEPVG